ncbi:sulfurtransferase [Vitiosangium sp. GDMCC 1.1324]|uniref:sulfurtransferase n=1 Tax=Vitiosangium sp. (strain GDMCC 1.1324) TaxID=2138576 RepID=UPI0018EE9A9D|nr:sulfurtransferase [Vitiosangium sp. GDMCC 1.1324]
MMNQKLLLSPRELAEARARGENIVIIDTRAPEEYAAGHIPGAVNVRDVFTYLSSSTPEGLATMQHKFADLFGQAGLSGKETAVIYEDAMNNGYGQSCRGYFLLKYLGHPRVAILHGGLRAWMKEGLPLSTEPVEPEPKRFPLDPKPELMIDRDEMLRALKDPSVVLLDVRDQDEWVGASSSPYGVDFCPRKGRIPGAVWIEWYQMMRKQDDIPLFISKDEVRSLCASVGIQPEAKVYLYCFKGARAANTLVAMKEAGFDDVHLYFGSWNEWSRDPALPIEQGEPDSRRMAPRA